MDIIKNNDINIFFDTQALFHAGAMDFISRAKTAIKTQGKFNVVLPGGNTPKLFFDALVEMTKHTSKLDWEKIVFFFGDERYVPNTSSENNYHIAYEHLFSKVCVNPQNIHRIFTEFKNPHDAARDYEETLRTIFHSHTHEFPKFDVVYLGLGEDAHTASLMPFSSAVMRYCTPEIQKNYQLVDALWVPGQNMYRITLTPTIINHASSVVFMVTGVNKALAVYRTLEGTYEPQSIPAQLIHCENSKNFWYLDLQAASQLEIERHDI